MRVSTFATLALAATANARFTPAHKPVTALEEYSVPGDNPLLYCEDPKEAKYILDIDNVDIDPNPPKAGVKLKVTAKGELSEDIEEGAKVNLIVKYGVITIIRQQADLCDVVKNVDLECPLKAGSLELLKEIDLPSQIPNGKYSVSADVVTKDGDKITCLQAHVEFKRDSSLVDEVKGRFKIDM